MTYTRYVPSSPLDAYIDDFYYLDGAAPYHHIKVFPMPSLHLMINFGEGFRVSEAEQKQTFTTCKESWSVGLWSKYHIVEWPSKEAAERFYDSEEYQPYRQRRIDGAQNDFVLVAGEDINEPLARG